MSTPRCTVACYYFPNYHVDPRNERQHGKGWMEWELVKYARPRFAGHQQPKIPLWGYEDESDPAVMAKKIDVAADHNIDAFIYDWYYYNDGPFLERGLEKGFFGAPNNKRLKFGIMWANHDWFDIHPAKRAIEPPLQFPGMVTPETFDRMTSYVVDHYFSHPSYWLINKRPYFSFYELSKLIAGFGGVDATRKALDAFREKTRKAGFPDAHLNAVVWGHTILPNEEKVKNPAELVARLGFDSVTSYVWIHHVALPEYPETPFKYVMDKYFEYADQAVKEYQVPYYPNASVGWDSSPRTCISDVADNSSYPFTCNIGGNTPKAFGDGMWRAKEFVLNPSPARKEYDRIITVNSWNEWTEGSYLEPDTVNGLGYLQTLRDVMDAERWPNA